MFCTETFVLEETNEWIKNIDKSLLNGVIFLDLKNAFDTMDHAILLLTETRVLWSYVPNTCMV